MYEYIEVINSMSNCSLCPRNCNIDRSAGKKGFCNTTEDIMLSRAALHLWEEPCISGNTGSGTVFFSGCTLRCVFCQNKNISNGMIGKTVTSDRLCDIFFELKEKGAANINLVTADHYIPQISKAIKKAKLNNLDLPFVYNTSSYVKSETLKQLEGLIDIYLPDLKYMDKKIALRYSKASDYPEIAVDAVDTMYKQVGTPVFDECGMMKKGMIVRHLVLPGNVLNSKKVIKYLYETYGDNIYISIMSQYTPCTDLSQYPEINRKITEAEYSRVVEFANSIGVTNAYIQEGEAASESFIPAFDYEGV